MRFKELFSVQLALMVVIALSALAMGAIVIAERFS